MQSYLAHMCPKLCQCPGERFRIIQRSENTKQNLSLFVSFTRLVAEQEPRRLVRSPSMHCSPLGFAGRPTTMRTIRLSDEEGKGNVCARGECFVLEK